MPRKKAFQPRFDAFGYNKGPDPDPSPQALEREKGTLSQINQKEGTYEWGGRADNLPLLILDAVNESPVTTSCLEKKESFMRGSGFTDPGLEALEIDADGTTLWDLHCHLVHNVTYLRSFSTNFKFDDYGKITLTYCIGTETTRLVAPNEGSQTIDFIKHNPYWGVKGLFKDEFTTRYPVFDLDKVGAQMEEMSVDFPGQLYWWGEVRSPYKFYPIPKYWSGQKWIRSDAKIGTYVDELLDNGFFQSVLMQVVGNPNEMSKDPRQMKEVTGKDGVKRKEATKTVYEEFNDKMSANFSGVKKAGSVFVQWLSNMQEALKLQEFPTNADFDFVSGTAMEIIRHITIATQVPGVLANLPDTTSPLSSGGDAIEVATEFMQGITMSDRVMMENFYNTILLPNLQKPVTQKVKIKNYVPVRKQITVPDKIWDWLNDQEKADFVKNNVPGVTLFRNPAQLTAPITTTTETPPVETTAIDENLKGLKISEINRISSILKKYNTGALTLEQAKQLLASYGINDDKQTAWLTPTL